MNKSPRDPAAGQQILPLLSIPLLFLVGSMVLTAITAADTLVKPNCQDSATKTFFDLAVRWLPWLLVGMVLGYARPQRWMLLVPTFFLLAYPFVAYVWMKLAFRGWSDWPHYWRVLSLPLPLIVVGCLTVSGGLVGSLFREVGTRQRAVALLATSLCAFAAYASIAKRL